MRTRMLVLAGSGEFTQTMDETDRYVLEWVKKNGNIARSEKIRVAILPTAAGKEKGYGTWITDGVRHFSALGADAFGVAVLNKDDANNAKLIELVRQAQIIYFSGGDPGHLYRSIKGTLLQKEIVRLYKKGIVLAGSSAGAMLMGTYVLENVYTLLKHTVVPKWEKALGMVPYSIFPHYDFAMRQQQGIFKRVIDLTPEYIKKTILGIDEDTAVVVINDSDAIVMGKGNVHVLGKKKEILYHSQESFKIKGGSV